MTEGTVFAVVVFPTPWPPTREVLLFSRQLDQSRIDVHADVSGRLTLNVSGTGGPEFHYKFQPLEIRGSLKAIVALTWSQSEASLRINGESVPADTGADPVPFPLVGTDGPTIPERVFPDLRIRSATTEPERFFLNTLTEIEDKLQERSAYSVIRASALLRQLILDERPLVNEVSRTYGKKLRFETLDYTIEPPVKPDVHWTNLDPGFFPGAKTITVDLRTLLAAPCLTTHGRVATVKDLIKACANAKGGVHLGPPKPGGEETILAWDRSARLLGTEPSLRALAGICRVVLRGLKPLVDEIVTRSA